MPEEHVLLSLQEYIVVKRYRWGAGWGDEGNGREGEGEKRCCFLRELWSSERTRRERKMYTFMEGVG